MAAITECRRVLSVDGGGFRGYAVALILQEIERRTQQATAKMFDYMGGTSIGTAIVSGLAMPREGAPTEPKFSAADVAKLFREKGKEIFYYSDWKIVRAWRNFTHLFRREYDPTNLYGFVDHLAGPLKLSQAVTNLALIALDLESATPWVFDSENPKFKEIAVADILKSCTAATSYFPSYSLEIEGRKVNLEDAGIAQNNPEFVTYAKAHKVFGDTAKYFVLSIGTGTFISTGNTPEKAARDGEIQVAEEVVGDGIKGQEETEASAMTDLLGENHIRIQLQFDAAHLAMDNPSDDEQRYIESAVQEWINNNDLTLQTIVQKLLHPF